MAKNDAPEKPVTDEPETLDEAIAQRDEAREVARGLKAELDTAKSDIDELLSQPKNVSQRTYDLAPLNDLPSCQTLVFDALQSGQPFLYHECGLFGNDSGWSPTVIETRAQDFVKRAIGPDSMNRIGYRTVPQEGKMVDVCTALPDFGRNLGLHMAIWIGEADDGRVSRS